MIVTNKLNLFSSLFLLSSMQSMTLHWTTVSSQKTSMASWIGGWILSGETNIQSSGLILLWILLPLTYIKLKTSGLVVLGGDSCSKGCGLESRRRILDGHEIFSHWFVVNIVLFVWKRPKINEKEAGTAHFLKRLKFLQCNIHFLNVLLCTW